MVGNRRRVGLGLALALGLPSASPSASPNNVDTVSFLHLESSLGAVPRRVRPNYRAIQDYGLIGDCASAALVASDGSVDWWCPGRFDAPSVFAAVLDRENGGHFRVHGGDRAASSSAYVPSTNVLRTSFRTGRSMFELLDFMPMPSDGRAERMVRIVRGLRGSSKVRAEFAPRFDYGRVAPRMRMREGGGVVASGGGQTLLLDAPCPLELEDGAAVGSFPLAEGESAAFVLYHRPYELPVEPRRPVRDPQEALDRTIAYWIDWTRPHEHVGEWSDLALRSALTLKLLTYEPTGAVVAAPTCSLPEWIGGVRNWDYRFAWVRDAVFAVRALAEVGHRAEATRFIDWIVRSVDPDPQKLRVLYSVAGTECPREHELAHLSGYRGSKPVRIGNAAEQQYQLDVYGELVEGAHACGILRDADPEGPVWTYFRGLADFVADNWRRPDQGIWEMRCPPRHFVLSKAMAWAALDRMASVADEHGKPGDVERWRGEAAAVRAEALENGWSPELNAFKQSYEVATLDASNLLLPLVGFVPADDPRMLATIDRTIADLTVNGLVYRYLDGRDGLPGGEASFTYCTFWLVEVLAMAGRVREARWYFEGVLARASPLGLFAEEIDPVSGDHLGNYPQGFPHIGLIRAARRLREAEAVQPRTPGSTTRLPIHEPRPLPEAGSPRARSP